MRHALIVLIAIVALIIMTPALVLGGSLFAGLFGIF